MSDPASCDHPCAMDGPGAEDTVANLADFNLANLSASKAEWRSRALLATRTVLVI